MSIVESPYLELHVRLISSYSVTRLCCNQYLDKNEKEGSSVLAIRIRKLALILSSSCFSTVFG